jgi:TolB-like protein/DNA-binding winged helix-turn-helix (wHTH) protein/tetratricopeptide (TPR) repeat protein
MTSAWVTICGVEEKQKESVVYKFGAFELDLAAQTLTLNSNEIELQRKALDLLVFLIENRQRAVTKDELQSAIWPRSIITEAALTRAVMKARKALRADGQERTWIKTVHGRGYRFVGGVEVSVDAAARQSAATPSTRQAETRSPTTLNRAAEVMRLRRNQLLRVVTAYGAFAWLLNQGAAVVWEAFEWQRWGQQALLLVTLAGFIPALVMGWFFLLTPDGLLRPNELSRTADLRRGGWISSATIGMLILALGVSIYWNFRTTDQLRRVSPSEQASIAVLPFRNLTANGEFGYFSEGLAVSLLQGMSNVDGLRVVARTSSFQFRDTDIPVQSIAEQLNVSYLLEGSVQRFGDRIRIDTALLAGIDGKRVWSNRFDGEADDLFELQDNVADSVAIALERVMPELGSAHSGAALRGLALRGTDNLAAYEAYLKGLEQMGKRTGESLPGAAAYFTEAVMLDPRYAKAWATLAMSKFTIATFGIGNRAQGFGEARAAATKAIGFDPTLSLPYRTLAEVQSRYEWKFAAALASLRTAAELAPNNPDVATSYGGLLSKLGRHDEAVIQVQKAWSSDPLNAGVAASLMIRFLRVGRFDDAEAMLTQIQELRPSHGDRHWLRAQLHIGRHEYNEALAAIAKDDLDYLRLSVSAIVLHHLGRDADSTAMVSELIEIDSAGAAFQIAEVYAQRAEADEAFVWLERAYVARDPGIAEMLSSLMLEPLYGDPRFEALLERVGLRGDMSGL